MPYVEDYTEHEYGDVHFDESQEFNGDGYENFGDGSYGNDNEVHGDYQQRGRMNGHHEPNRNQNNGDDGARWPHADKSNADLDMLVDYVISKAIELGVLSDSEADNPDEHYDSGDYNDRERDARNSEADNPGEHYDLGDYDDHQRDTRNSEADNPDEHYDLGDYDDHQRDARNSEEYGDDEGGDMGECQNDEGNGATGAGAM